ncbi:MAG TPA: polymorphic toxin-type HINT domain-containing protein [Pilimelia sp.]|nr:polymorphic toxin-type HINT domain-containing protein [Pilimelia sp.]
MQSPPRRPPVRGYDAATSREVTTARGAHERVFTNADGTQTTQFSTAPVNYRRTDGTWAPIDDRLRPAADGRPGWRNGTDAVDVRIAARADAAELARFTVDGGHAVAYRLAGAAPVPGRLTAEGVVYPGVLAGVDLRLAARAGSVKESIVLRSAAAPRTFVFPLHLSGLTARLAGGGVELVDAGGRPRAVIPPGFMVDSAPAPARSTGVAYRLVGAGARPALEVTFDAAWLADPARRFPVEVDPTVSLPVDGAAADGGMYVHGSTSANGDQELRVGELNEANSAAYVRFNGLVSRLQHHTIFGAALQVVNYDAASCRARPVSVHPVTGAWSPGTDSSYPGPAVGGALATRSFAHGYIRTGQSTSACPAAPQAFDLGVAGRGLVQRWVSGQQANHGLSLRAPAGDGTAWKRFAGTGTANPPRLYVTHSPYNAGYAIPNPVPNPPVLQNRNGTVKVTVTNRSAEAWQPGAYYLAYRAYDARTGAEAGQQRAAGLTGTVPRGGRVTLDATIKSMPPGRYMLDFTMVRTGGAVFTDHQVPPGRIVLEVFDIPPVLRELHPPNGYQPPTLTPQLWATAVDPDAPPRSTLQYKFEVCDRTAAGAPTACTNSGFHPATAWSVPAGRLSWSTAYMWRVVTKDASTEVPSPYSVMLTAVPQPDITSRIAGAPQGARDREFDPNTGNVSTAAVDAAVPTAGPELNVLRTYNSLDPRRDLAFGAGWATKYDMTLASDGDGSGNMVVTYPDGQTVRFGRNPDGTYAAPPGRTARLRLDGTTYKLTDRSGTTYQLGSPTAPGDPGRLISITDLANRAVTLRRDIMTGRLVQAQVANSPTNRAGRSLHFTWQGRHVDTVRTDPVDGAPLTWKYTYEGDRLRSVCGPESACTTYDYGPGSHYRTAVLDSRPESYWRLGDAEGTGAASEVAVNLGKDAGTYRSAAQGRQGALAGTGDTAATFNGSSSNVGLPNGALKKSRDGAVELWFNVNQTGQAGPLLGYQDKAVGTAATKAVPVLYVGTDGRLRGQFATTGVPAPIIAPQLVNDGKWHHVVLAAMGDKQILYLDGVKAGELTGTIDHTTLTFNQVGAASAVPPASWPQWGTAAQRYFNGGIDEVAVYSSPLGPAAVASHYEYGKVAADQLTKVTLPSGRVAAELAYDVALDRVAEYTDRDGGTWKIGAPLVFGGDTDLRRGVQVLDPANRPHLYEYDALTGRLLRSGTPMGRETREEDQPRPSASPSPSPSSCTTPDPGDPGFCTVIPGDDGGPVIKPVSSESTAIRTYFYDAAGNQYKVVNENGQFVEMGFDARGNVATKKSCRTPTECHTSYYTYPAVITDPFDPRNDLPTEVRDGRSASAADTTYRTRYTYHFSGELASQTNPDGSSVSHLYTVGAEVAVGGGSPPAGLLRATTDERQKVTSYQYFQNGDLARVTSPSGLIMEFTYDALGRRITEKEISDTYPAGVVTRYSYDGLGRQKTVTGPATTGAVSGERHQAQTVLEYDRDGNVEKTTVQDLLGDDAPRVAQTRYDDAGRPELVTDPEGNETRYGYDRFGNRTFMQDPNDNRYEYAYTARNALAEVRLRDWAGDPPGAPNPGDYLVLHSYSYDYAGRLESDTDSMGRRLEYAYYFDDLLHKITMKGFRNADGSTRDYVVEENTYDAAGYLKRRTSANGKVATAHTVDAAGRVIQTIEDPDRLNRATTYRYDPAGNVTRVTRAGNHSNVPWLVPVVQDVIEYGYDDAGNQTTETVIGPSGNSVTSYGYDRRGALTSITDPRGNVTGATKADFTTTFDNDEAGRRTRTTAPPVAAESAGGPAQTVRPVTAADYDSFGDLVASADELGNVSRAEYDKAGRRTATIAPRYTTAGGLAVTPTTRTAYDGLGNVLSVTAPGGAVTRYTYDQLGRVVTRDEPASTNDERAVWRYTYTRTGEVLSTTDPTGARVESTYDDLDRQITLTHVERRPVPENFTTRFGYDDAGNLTTMAAPSGATTVNTYDTVGALLSTRDPSGVVTQFGYDYVGRQVRLSDGMSRTSRTTFDTAGRLAAEQDLAPDGTVIRAQRYGYDPAGNLTTATDPYQKVTTFAYDARNQLVRQVEPVSPTAAITTTFGYDAAGARTRYTDGRGNPTIYTTNSLGLPESVIEPATAAHPAAADRTWSVGYDSDGRPARLSAPGGVLRQRGYDAAGRLTEETGSGAEAGTQQRVLRYDLAGRVASAGTPGGTNTYTYNDRGGLLAATGPGGTAGFGYNNDGQLVRRADAAGEAAFTYASGRLKTVTDGVTSNRQTLDYNAAGQTKTIDYGAGRVRSFGYDNAGRLATDTVRNAAAQVVSSVAYELDLNDHVVRKTTTGTAGAGDNTYGYDDIGRLTSWTSAAGTVEYGWDDSGNRVRAGPKTATYDERNRLRSDGDYTYAYTPRGTLRTRTSSGLADEFSFDAFDRLVAADDEAYAYDALDRVASRNDQAFGYAGLSDEVVAEGGKRYGRDGSDDLLAVSDGTDKRVVLADVHGDAVAQFDPADTVLPALQGSVAYDPFGKKVAAAGDIGNVGYQGDWTDPSTGQVNMGARWYQPDTGGFVSRDSVTYRSGASNLANRYAYGAGAPLDAIDPDGHWPKWVNKGLRAVSKGVSWAANKAWSGIKQVGSWAWQGLNYAWSGLKATGSWLVDKVKAGFNKVAEGIRWIGKKASEVGNWANRKAQEIRRAAIAQAKRVTAVAKKAVEYAVRHTPLKVIAAVAKPLLSGLTRLVSAAASLPARAVAALENVVKDTWKGAKEIYDKAVAAAGPVLETVSKAADGIADFVEEHRATILGIAAGVGVGLVCGAAIGWTGVGAVACGALAGAVGSFVTGYVNGERGWDLAGSTALGGLLGGVTGGLFSVGGAALGAGIRSIGQGFRSAAGQAAGAARAEVSNIASGRIGGLLGRACRKPNSFTPNTAVVMANGSSKPISEVKVGDTVLATDPTTDRTEKRRVTDVMVGDGEKKLVEVTVDTDGTAGTDTGTVTATDEHPFWVDSENRWVDAKDLKPGYEFRTADNRPATVVGTRAWTQTQQVYNLEVDTLHTYYVLAGNAQVLVHNCVGNSAPFKNQMSNLENELALADSLGVRPVGPGEAGFDDVINSGTLKWAITEGGAIRVMPKTVNSQEIAHTALTRGAPVRAAGEAEIAGGGGEYFGLRISSHSGHYRPCYCSLDFAANAFRNAGIRFGPESMEYAG